MFTFSDGTTVIRADLDTVFNGVRVTVPPPAGDGYARCVRGKRGGKPLGVLNCLDISCAATVMNPAGICDQKFVSDRADWQSCCRLRGISSFL